MSKSVMISIKPKWVELIASGGKTVEVRKTFPKIDVPFKCYIYETQGRKWKNKNEPQMQEGKGRVVGEFVCDKIGDYVEGFSFNQEKICISLKAQACLTNKEVWDYSGGKDLYGWHISNLKMYDKPKELSEFHKHVMPTGLRYEDDEIRRPFQSWGYVEELE